MPTPRNGDKTAVVFGRTTLIAALLAASLSSPLFAQTEATPAQSGDTATNAADAENAAERIALAGELRMLSQRVVSAACFLHAGLEPDSSRETLALAVAEFETIAAALQFGNADLGITLAEERPRTLAGLMKLAEQWAPIGEHVRKVSGGEGSLEDISAISAQSADLLDTINRLVVQITSQYARQTTVLTSDALRLDLAGRQRTLAQQIAKNGCLIAASIDANDSAAELRTAAANFEASMDALRFGREDVGILPPPDQAIVDSLADVARQWSFMSRIVTSLADGQTVEGTTLGVMFLMSNQVTDNMEMIVDQFAEASKLRS